MVRFTMVAVAMVVAGSLAMADEAPQPRFGVAVKDSSNNAGVYVVSVDDDSPASRLRRVADGSAVTLQAKKHAIIGFNGWPIHNSKEYVEAMAYAPKRCVFEVYDYDQKASDYLQTELNGEPIALPVQPAPVVTHQSFQYQASEAASDRRGGSKRGGGLFGLKNRPQGDDWQPGDQVWLFQKKPTDPGLRKEYNRQMTAEVITGIATGLSEGMDEWDSWGSSTPAHSFGGHSHHGGRSHHNGLQEKWNAERNVFNRTYSTNPNHGGARGGLNLWGD